MPVPHAPAANADLLLEFQRLPELAPDFALPTRRSRRRAGAAAAVGEAAGFSQQACTRALRLCGRFRIDVALADHAAERRLDMRARAAEPVVEVEMAEGGVHVVPPQQPDHPAAEPDAFRVAGRAADQAGGFGELVDLALGVLGGIGRLGRRRLVAGLGIAALGEGRAGRKHRHRRKQDGEAENARRGTWPGRLSLGRCCFATDAVALSEHRMGPICGLRRANR